MRILVLLVVCFCGGLACESRVDELNEGSLDKQLQPDSIVGAGQVDSHGLAQLITIKALRSEEFDATLILERHLPPAVDYQSLMVKSFLVSYQSDGLTLYALVNKPSETAPESGFPVVVFGHGFHPKPLEYGVRKSSGERLRPGDYYSRIPEAYVRQGYMVITPDYRGHADSEGYEFTRKSYLAQAFYSRDLLNLVSGLGSLPEVDLDNLFFVGHSMGGDVGLRAALATDRFSAISLWSSVLGSSFQQALYYGQTTELDFKHGQKPFSTKGVDRETFAGFLEGIEPDLAGPDMARILWGSDPINHVHLLQAPVIVQHARGDLSVPYIWSEGLVARLQEYGLDYRYFRYESDDHLFKGDEFERAVARDLEFFKRYSR